MLTEYRISGRLVDFDKNLDNQEDLNYYNLIKVDKLELENLINVKSTWEEYNFHILNLNDETDNSFWVFIFEVICKIYFLNYLKVYADVHVEDYKIEVIKLIKFIKSDLMDLLLSISEYDKSNLFDKEVFKKTLIDNNIVISDLFDKFLLYTDDYSYNMFIKTIIKESSLEYQESF